MRIELVREPIFEKDAGAAVVLAFDKDSPGDGAGARLVNERTGGWLAELYESGEFSGKSLELAILHRPDGFNARRLVVLGCGRSDKFTPGEMRKVAGALLRALKPKGVGSIALMPANGFDSEEFLRAAVEGVQLGDFEPNRYKTEKKDEKSLEVFSITIPDAPEWAEAAIERGRIIAEAQNFTRELVNEPANRLTPGILAARAKEMATAAGLECEVLDQDRMKQLGMGALLGVAQGSYEPPALIIIRYKPEGSAPGDSHLALIGKAVTFDTGGISIKPSDGMEKMKYDMAGGAAVIGAMQAISRLKPPIPVTAFIPAVENMPGSRAQRPGDIVTTLSGKTVEVLNTDAEGRLILADAITYAKRLGCTHLVDAATLTGAVVVALGHMHVGVFSNNDGFQEKILSAARAEGERSWPLPMDDDYKDYLKTPFADIANVGGRWGGAITAAIFLKEFAEDTPWVHLDIAGTAWLDDGKPFLAKGPSGVPIRTLVRLATTW